MPAVVPSQGSHPMDSLDCIPGILQDQIIHESS